MEATLGELARVGDCELAGDGATIVTHAAPLDRAGDGAISFLTSAAYRRHLAHTGAAAVILRPEDKDACPVAALVSANPYLAYARIAAHLTPQSPPAPGVHPSAVVDPSAWIDPQAHVGAQNVIAAGARIGAGAVIGPGCIIGTNAEVGEHTRLLARVTVMHECRLGARGLVHPGAVIGSDGFGIANDQGQWVKVPQLGRVVIGDDVEIGANTTVDRGALEDTVIEDGVKLDNQIQVAHNVRIGAHTAVAGCVGIAGSVTIGRHCAIGGGVGIAGHLEITDGVTITGMTLVTKSIRQSGVYSSGLPAMTNHQWHKNTVRYRHLDELARRLNQVERQLKKDP